jgi:signal transduction histidine kinase/CheY-like chemotaxis protein
VSDHEANVRRLARVLSQISHTLESVDERVQRVEHALALAREVVPARRSALLEVHDGVASLYVWPPEDPDEREQLTVKLTALYKLVADGDDVSISEGAKPSLALPVMGLDEIIGVLRVEAADDPYDARHLRLFSVIAAQLGAYLAMVRLREREAARAKEIETAHDFQRLLAGVVGHDLRNPLAVITAVASSLLENTSDPKQTISLQRALRNAEHATKLISDLVDVTESRVTGLIRIEPQAADYKHVLELTLDDLHHAHGARTIDLAVDPAMTSTTGIFDPTRLGQIVTNLVNNAVIHGEPSLPINVRLAEEDGFIVISVRNWGPPIPDTLIPTIFDPFKQGTPSHRPHNARGLGLGLYIVDCLSRGHGGTVTVTSDADTGTVFRVRLPRDAAPATHLANPHTERPLVMIVDDDQDVCIALAALLTKRGYEVATATDGLAALMQLREGLRPRLIFLDYQMPVMNGEEFCDQCARYPELAAIPVVIVSSDTASALKLAKTRARGVLTKPVPIDKLIDALNTIV